jgi:hypothetical protein
LPKNSNIKTKTKTKPKQNKTKTKPKTRSKSMEILINEDKLVTSLSELSKKHTASGGFYFSPCTMRFFQENLFLDFKLVKKDGMPELFKLTDYRGKVHIGYKVLRRPHGKGCFSDYELFSIDTFRRILKKGGTVEGPLTYPERKRTAYKTLVITA